MSRIAMLIKEEAVTSVFQPVISIDQKKIIGFEALARANAPFHDLTPEAMFAAAEEEGCLLALDRLCRKKAIEQFSTSAYRDSFLFINLNAGIIDKDVLGSLHLYRCVTENGLRPNQVVIEIVESKAKDLDSLISFISFYRNQGFTIALDDIGAAYSNLERIAILKPDILKIDRSLIADIHKEFYKKEILKSLVTLGNGIGSLIIAEGVENKDDALAALHLGATMLQGYHIQQPSGIKEIKPEEILCKKNDLAKEYRASIIDATRSRREIRGSQYRSIDLITGDFLKHKKDELILVINRIFYDYEGIECIYVLDEYGLQVTETIFSKEINQKQIRPFYQPGVIGTDHSMKDYYYQNHNGVKDFYRSCPYLSRATGTRCITVSKAVLTSDGYYCMICIDFTENSPLWL